MDREGRCADVCASERVRMNEYLNEYTIEYVNAWGFPCSMVVFSHNEAEAIQDFVGIYPSIKVDSIRLTRSNFTYGRYDHAKNQCKDEGSR